MNKFLVVVSLLFGALFNLVAGVSFPPGKLLNAF